MISFPNDVSVEGYRFLVPSVAVGNLAQLCVDLLIANEGLKKVGQCWSKSFLPIVGQDPYDLSSTRICTAADFYIDHGNKLVILQLRSPCIGSATDLFDELSEFVKERKIGKTIIVTSSYDYERPSMQGDRSELRILDSNLESVSEADAGSIPGGGFASALFNHLRNNGQDCTVAFRHCSEGDNVSDALDFTGKLNRKFQLVPEAEKGVPREFKCPPSWDHFFGNPPPMELY